jgi:hypothetical protein
VHRRRLASTPPRGSCRRTERRGPAHRVTLRDTPQAARAFRDCRRAAQFPDFRATKYQPKIDQALRESELVHYARVVVIGDRFLQVITEYDGDHKGYTEFFRRSLPEVFDAIFALAEGAPAFDKLNQNSFFEITKSLQHRSLGESTDGQGNSEGYLFSAFGGRSVKEILAKLNQA